MPPERKREIISHLPSQVLAESLSAVPPAEAAAQLSSLVPPDRQIDVINGFPDAAFALDVDERLTGLASPQDSPPPAAAALLVLNHSAAAPVSQQQAPSVANPKASLAHPSAAPSKPSKKQLPSATRPLLTPAPPQPATSDPSVKPGPDSNGRRSIAPDQLTAPVTEGPSIAAFVPDLSSALAAIPPEVGPVGPVTPPRSAQTSKPALDGRSRAVAWTPSSQAGLPRVHPSAMATKATVLEHFPSPASPTPTNPRVDAGFPIPAPPRLTPSEPDVYASHSQNPLIAAESKPSPGSPNAQKPVGPKPSSSAPLAPSDAVHGDEMEVDLDPPGGEVLPAAVQEPNLPEGKDGVGAAMDDSDAEEFDEEIDNGDPAAAGYGQWDWKTNKAKVKEWNLEDDVKVLDNALYTSPALTLWMYRARRDGKFFKTLLMQHSLAPN